MLAAQLVAGLPPAVGTADPARPLLHAKLLWYNLKRNNGDAGNVQR